MHKAHAGTLHSRWRNTIVIGLKKVAILRSIASTIRTRPIICATTVRLRNSLFAV